MIPHRRATLALLSLALLAACDRPADPSPPKPVTTSAPASLKTLDFADDAAFATYAASLEPAAYTYGKDLNTLQLFDRGGYALGYFDNAHNYTIWTVAAAPGQFRSYSVDPNPPGNMPTGFGSLTSYARVSPDGTWGYFLWPGEGDAVRVELWKLPKNKDEKPTRFHIVENQKRAQLERPSISGDSMLLMCRVDGKPALFLVDAAQSKVQPIALKLPDDWADTKSTRTRAEFFGPGPMIAVRRVTHLDADDEEKRRYLLATGTLTIEGNPVTAKPAAVQWIISDAADDPRPIAVSPDGRMMIVQPQVSLLKDQLPASLWRLPASPSDKPALITALPHNEEDFDVFADWSNDGKRLAMLTNKRMLLFDTAGLLEAKAMKSVPVMSNLRHIAFAADGTHVTLMHRYASSTTVPLDNPTHVDAKIGESRIVWDVGGDAPPIDKWPALRVSQTIVRPPGAAATAVVEVTNTGAGPAHQVRATIDIAPPLSAPKDAGAEAQQIARLATLHIGTLDATFASKRYFDLPADPALLNRARRFTFSVTSKHGFNPAPLHWLYLPRTIESEEQYHATAKAVFAAASQVIVEARGVPFAPAPTLAPLHPEGYGFLVGFGRVVEYQNAFTMNENALRVNRAVMQVDSRDELMRHAQMMLYWYIPHELVHCADHRSSWATEFVANTIQPYATARMLEKMPDAPYTSESMAFVYDRYVEALKPHLSSDEIARVERFIQSDGQVPPWNMSAPDLFRSNTPAYVYFGARINQHSWSKQSKLEDLCKQYLMPVKEEKKEE